jgi:hypothetical protein
MATSNHNAIGTQSEATPPAVCLKTSLGGVLENLLDLGMGWDPAALSEEDFGEVLTNLIANVRKEMSTGDDRGYEARLVAEFILEHLNRALRRGKKFREVPEVHAQMIDQALEAVQHSVAGVVVTQDIAELDRIEKDSKELMRQAKAELRREKNLLIGR